MDSAALKCPEKKGAFEQVPLSMRRIEEFEGNLELQLQREVASWDFFSLALDESCDIRDTAQLLIFVRGITDFKITEELAAMRSMKGTTTGSEGDVFTEVNACMDTGIEMGQTGSCHNGRLSKTYREKCLTFET